MDLYSEISYQIRQPHIIVNKFRKAEWTVHYQNLDTKVQLRVSGNIQKLHIFVQCIRNKKPGEVVPERQSQPQYNMIECTSCEKALELYLSYN